MVEEVKVVLRRSESCGLGFSLLGTAGLPPIIYDIIENSPAAESGEVEAGDVILKVNETDVNRFSTKEVLKCLRLSADPVTLKLKRDPVIKARVRHYLSSPQHLEEDLTDFISREQQDLCNNSISSSAPAASSNNQQQSQSDQQQPLSSSSPLSDTSNGQTGDEQFQSPSSPPQQTTSNGTCSYATCSELEALLPTGTQGGSSSIDSFEEGERLQWEPLLGSDKFSRPRPPRFEAFMMTGDLILNLSRTQQSSGLLPKHQKKVDSLRYHHHHHHHYNHHHHHNSVPTSPNEMEMGHRNHHHFKSASAPPGGTTSAGTSPVGLNKRDNSICNQPSCTASSSNQDTKSSSPASASAFPYHHTVGGFVRTSRSEDHLQFQKDSSMSAVDIDIDEDVTSSLNTLLDTRQDSGGSSNNVAQPLPGAADATGATTNNDRIVWTYNAPIVSSPSNSGSENSCCGGLSSAASRSGSSAASRSASCTSSEGVSPQRSLSPASPTSVSSSVMSSNSSSRRIPMMMTGAITGPAGDSTSYLQQPNGDLSQSEAISNISSPDFQEEETLDILSTRDLMEVSDPSDSDSTLLVSDRTPAATTMNNNNPQQLHHLNNNKNQNSSADGVHLHSNVVGGQGSAEHRIVIQVKGPDKDGNVLRAPSSPRGTRRTRGGQVPPTAGRELDLMYSGLNAQQPSRSPSSVSSGNVTPELAGYQLPYKHQELRESEDELTTMGDDAVVFATMSGGGKATSPPLSSEDESDIESLHSFHYSPKAVDIPSAIRLAKRLYMLDGFKKSDVSRHLSKNNDFSRVVAEEYLKYFSFEGDTLDVALRKFLKQFSLTGETQERERVLVHFSKRFLDCNPGTFNSQDAVHTLTCAIMLLNTDLHGQNIGRKMTCSEFIENLSELNDGDNFPREVLKHLYQAIKSYPLEWALDEEGDECSSVLQQQAKQAAENQQNLATSSNPFLDVPNAATAIEYKKGYVMRKSCIDPNGKKTPFGKRGWKMFYCTLRDMVLYLHKDEHGFRKSALSDNLHNAIRIHHALATKASDYTKKQHVFRLQTADQAEYLFQTSDSKELQSWIDTINFVCASFSAQPLAGAVGSQRKFQRPLLPCSHTKLNLREQLRDHEERVQRLEAELEDHRRHPPERSAKSLNIQNYKEKDVYLHYELKRYKTYAYLLRSRISQYPELEPSLVETCIGEVDEGGTVTLMEAAAAAAVVGGDGGGIIPPPVPDRRASPTTNRSFSVMVTRNCVSRGLPRRTNSDMVICMFLPVSNRCMPTTLLVTQ
ncbi:PH and SEC7 domain-containing protein isoform X3 [Periplaneta americana]|uniref:PH and SEC7 domain-containing protein isoform X3 n=1 Tax=Periplaneta americana TaxID=6978 RepID=UPI0037E78EF9